MSTLTLGGCHSGLLHRNTCGFAETKLFVCRSFRRSLMVAQLLEPGRSQLCVSLGPSSAPLPSEFWRDAAPRILKACRVRLRSPKLQLLGTLLGLSSRLGSMLGERRKTWTPPRPPGTAGTPGATAGDTPGQPAGTATERRKRRKRRRRRSGGGEEEEVRRLWSGNLWPDGTRPGLGHVGT